MATFISTIKFTEQGIKARFASVRMQALQDEFARFASDIQRIKAEIISKHFEPETIISRSNIQFTDDAQLAMQAVQLLKSPRFAHYRVEVKPEAVNMTDFAALKAERTEFMSALSGFFTAMAPIGQAMPGSVPYLLDMCKWFVAGMKGSSTIEATLDRAIEAAKMAQQQAAMNPQQAPPDPKLQAAQLKMQGDQMRAQTDMMKEKAKIQGDLIRIQAETEAKDQQEKSQALWNTWETAHKHAITKQPGATSTPPQRTGPLRTPTWSLPPGIGMTPRARSVWWRIWWPKILRRRTWLRCGTCGCHFGCASFFRRGNGFVQHHCGYRTRFFIIVL
jgi:hypothetical protein